MGGCPEGRSVSPVPVPSFSRRSSGARRRRESSPFRCSVLRPPDRGDVRLVEFAPGVSYREKPRSRLDDQLRNLTPRVAPTSGLDQVAVFYLHRLHDSGYALYLEQEVVWE